MKFIVMIYNRAEVWDALTQTEKEAVWNEGGKLWQGLVASGEGIMGEPLTPPAESRIVRNWNGSSTVTDGPFAEAKEQFVGFMLIDVVNEARAVEIASSWPDAKYSSLEIRRINVSNEGLAPDHFD